MRVQVDGPLQEEPIARESAGPNASNLMLRDQSKIQRTASVLFKRVKVYPIG